MDSRNRIALKGWLRAIFATKKAYEDFRKVVVEMQSLSCLFICFGPIQK